MSDYVDISDNLLKQIQSSFRDGPIINDKGQRIINEATMCFIEPHIRVSTFSRENESPHFRLDYQGYNCRYDLFTCEPLDIVPKAISKYSRNITKWYKENRDELINFYETHLSDDAPPQSKIHR